MNEKAPIPSFDQELRRETFATVWSGEALGSVVIPGPQREPFAPAIEEAVQRVRAHVRPQALWRRGALSWRAGRLTVERAPGEEISLETRGMPEAFRGRDAAIFLALTLGPLEDVGRDGAHEEDLLGQYVLSRVATWLLEHIRHEAWERVRTALKVRGEGLGSSVAPGEEDTWPLEGQRALASLLDLESMGVALNERNVLDPLLSCTAAAAVVPLNEEICCYDGEAGSGCWRCALGAHCVWRAGRSPEGTQGVRG